MEKLATASKSLQIASEPQEDTTKGTEFHLGVQEDQELILAHEFHGSRLLLENSLYLESDICLENLLKHVIS